MNISIPDLDQRLPRRYPRLVQAPTDAASRGAARPRHVPDDHTTQAAPHAA